MGGTNAGFIASDIVIGSELPQKHMKRERETGKKEIKLNHKACHIFLNDISLHSNFLQLGQNNFEPGFWVTLYFATKHKISDVDIYHFVP